MFADYFLSYRFLARKHVGNKIKKCNCFVLHFHFSFPIHVKNASKIVSAQAISNRARGELCLSGVCVCVCSTVVIAAADIGVAVTATQ